MQNILAKLSYLPKKTTAVVIGAMFALVLTAAATANFGPDREIRVYEGPGTPGFEHVTFNSFTNVPDYGNEQQFMRGAVSGRDSSYSYPVRDVQIGDEIVVWARVHNNADPKLNASGEGVAQNVTFRADLPTESAKTQRLTGTIAASNAKPLEVYDDISITSDQKFDLEFVKGSVNVSSNKINQFLGAAGNSIVDGGISIGTDALDGIIPGCFEKIVDVTYKVRVVSNEPAYKINKEVRETGTSQWSENVQVDAGDSTDWRVSFENTGNTELKSVEFVDDMPNISEYMSIVPGSIKLFNGNYPNGYVFDDSAIYGDGKQIRINMGNYGPADKAFITFKTVIDPNHDLECGGNRIRLDNYAYVQPESLGAVNDGASVDVVTEACEEPNQVLTCDVLNVSPLTLKVGESITMNAEASTENGASISKYVFFPGDGSGGNLVAETSNKASSTHTYTEAGSYHVSVRVDGVANGEDVRVGQTGRCITSVTVEEQPEQVLACTALSVAPLTLMVGESITMDAEAIAKNGASISKYVFFPGDDTKGNLVQETGNSASSTHTYEKAGTFNVSVRVDGVVDGQDVRVGQDGACITKVTVEEQPVPVYSCDALVATPQNGSENTFRLAASATAELASVVRYTFNYGDGSDMFVVETADQVTQSEVHTYAPGSYQAAVAVTFLVNGSEVVETSTSCAIDIEVEEEPVDPVYECIALEAIDLGNLKVSLKATVIATDGATLNKVGFNYGDGESFDTNNFVGDGNEKMVSVTHEYEKAGNYEIEATVFVDVDGEQRTVTCVASVDLEDTPEVCEHNADLLKDDPNCKKEKVEEKPTVLPNTGPGSALMAIFGTSAIGAMLHGWTVSKRALRSSLINR